MKINSSILFLLFFILFSSKIKSQIVTHSFNFKGYSTIINDFTSDENGSHLLVGEIHSTKIEEENRDSTINRIFNIIGTTYNDDKYGILILTDKNFKILKIRNSFIGKKIIYDSKTREFTIGAQFFDYIKVGAKSFSAWQPTIVKTKIDLYTKSFFVSKPYSCILTDFFIEKDEVIIFTRSDNTFLDDVFSEKAEVIKVSLRKFHTDSLKPWIHLLDEKFSIQTPYDDIGRLDLSNVQKVNNSYYFTSSNLNQSTLQTKNHLYRFDGDSLHEYPEFEDYISYQTAFARWTNINEFFLSESQEFNFLTHVGASDKAMYFSKSNAYLDSKKAIEIPLLDYADFNKMIPLQNGNYLILSVNESENWSYNLYNSKIEFLKKIDTKISSDYYPTKFSELANNLISCSFYIDNLKNKDCLVQLIDVN